MSMIYVLDGNTSKDPNEQLTIGSLNFDELLDEATLGDVNFKKLGKGKIVVNSLEGDSIPHFHVCFSDRNDICIQITTNAYFSHKSHPDEFPSIIHCKQLNDWMNNIISDGRGNSVSNWFLIKFAWNMAHPDHQIDISLPQPDYKTIKHYKK